MLAKRILGRRSYKHDAKSRQSEDHRAARRNLLENITNGAPVRDYGLHVVARAELADDPQGDTLDALLCAVQAAWARRERSFGMPPGYDAIEGWIADPAGHG